MKQAANRSLKKPDLPNDLLHHAAIRAVIGRELPRTISDGSTAGRDFSRVPPNMAQSTGARAKHTRMCFCTPQRCYFGGVCHTCPSGVQIGSSVEIQRRAENSEKLFYIPPIVYEVLRSPGRPLEPQTCGLMEQRFGFDFSEVRVHEDALAAASARSLHASAYTVGNDIVFASGAYTPASSEGSRLLIHELGHVVEQHLTGNRIQCWGGSIHKEVTTIASDVLADEDVIPVAPSKSEFVEKLRPYSISVDYKARRLMWTGPLFLSGAVKGEGPDHGEDGNYQSEDVGAARNQNVTRQRAYIGESVRYYQQFVSSLTRGRQRGKGGLAIDRRGLWDVASAPLLGAPAGAIAGTLYGIGAARMVSKAVGGFWGGLLGVLTGLVTVPLGLAAGAVAGALGIGGLVSAGKSRPAMTAREGVLAALGDACHVAQDRASHWEGVRGYGHTDERTKSGWDPDDKEDNTCRDTHCFGGYEAAIRNTREVFKDWKSWIGRVRRSSSIGGGRPR